MPVMIGQDAPGFTLYDTNKKPVSLSDFRGKTVLLLFFPLAFTSVCTSELCGVRDNIGRYSNAKAEVLGISVDSLYTLAQFKEAQGYNFALLSDFNKEASASYDALYDKFPAFEMKGVSKRAAFIVDPNSNIVYAEVCASPGDMPDFAAINELLDKL